MRYYILAFLVYELLFSTYLYHLYDGNKKDYYNRTVSLVKNSLDSSINAYEMIYNDCYATQSDSIAKLVAMSNGASVEKRDEIREKLLNKYMTFFKYQKLNSLNGFHIFDMEGKSLLRFHQPTHHDDRIIEKRDSIKTMNKGFLYQEGFEVGVFQESYRFQYPLFYDGKFVGSYEYSVNTEALINEMENFYGDYHNLLFKSDFIENVVLSKIIKKNYQRVDIGSKYFYVNKNINIKKLDKKRFDYILSLTSFQNALNKDKISIVDYKFKSVYHVVVVVPMRDISKKEFAYLLVHLDKSPINDFRKTFLLEMLFVTLFGLMLYMYIYKEIQNRQYVKELINLQHDLIIVSDGKNIDDVNKEFLHFFGYETLDAFKDEHPCVCDMFIEDDGYLAEKKDELSWINYMQKHSDEKNHKVKMLNDKGDERIFAVEMDEIHDSHKFFILFRDITEELHIKEELEERANFDTLTQIFNRSRFDFFLKKELEKADRYGRIFSLIMFDIDHFKDINDTYGHDVGDVILKELTSLVSSHVRDVDVFARWGGEEFMIISQTNIYQSEMFAEKLRQIIEENNFTHVGSVQCSFGVTQYRKDDIVDTIVKRCDNMLYSAKESGRNCVASLK